MGKIFREVLYKGVNMGRKRKDKTYGMYSVRLGFDPKSDHMQVSAAIEDRSFSTLYGHEFEGDRGNLVEHLEAKLFHHLHLCNPISV
jgi:hypothetical protein